MLENREEQYSDRELAYTAPVESDAPSAFQFHSDLRPQPASRTKPRGNRRKWAVAIICIVLVILSIALAVSVFLLHYRIVLSRDISGIELRIEKREKSIIAPDDLFQPMSVPDGSAQGSTAGTADYEWNGATLKMEDPLKDGGKSWSGVYRECSEYVACVSAYDSDGNEAKGCAVVMSSDGFLITSGHILQYADDIQVTLQGQVYPAHLIGLDIASDLAVIRIQASGLIHALFGQSETAAPGEELAVIGTSSFGSEGIIPCTLVASASGYAYRGFPMDLFELNITTGEQCSGAPVLNRYGQVVGIVNSDISGQIPNPGNASFAIPIHAAKDIIDKLLEFGYVPGRPSSGLTVAEIPAAYAMFYKYPSCVYVAAVNENSTAFTAGIRKGDLILSANGVKIQSVDQLYAVINGMKAGDELTLELYREGDFGTISFPLMEATRHIG